MLMAETPWEYWEPQSGREHTTVIDRITLLAFVIQKEKLYLYDHSFMEALSMELAR